jgi:homoserine kinase type II
MALLTPLSLSEATRAASHFGLALAKLEPLSAGSVNSNFELWTRDGARFFARIYEEQDSAGAAQELALLRQLEACGLPVSPALSAADGSHTVSVGDKPLAIYPWVEGEIYCQRLVDAEAAQKVGEALAGLHLASESVAELGQGRFGIEGIRERLSRIEAEASPDLVLAAGELGAELEATLAQRQGDLPQGVIHGDLFRDNVLWRGGEIVALLDFESASCGTFSYDLAVTLLAWCFSDGFDSALCAALLGGYHQRRPLSAKEGAALTSEGAFACVRFAVTRITDFSMRAAAGQSPVRDYRRFVARLRELQAGALEAPLSTLALRA